MAYGLRDLLVNAHCDWAAQTMTDSQVLLVRKQFVVAFYGEPWRGAGGD